MNSVFSKESGQPVYLQMYSYFRNLILTGAMPSGTKLPSIRKCAEIYGVSKTTVEAAFVQLEAEGCIYSVAQSGFYVSEMSDFVLQGSRPVDKNNKIKKEQPLYDFTSSAADEESFDFNLWQRYVKSALRTGARLLDYGDPQGEEDLRKALCSYVSHSRGIICSENQIVIGAGVQNLLSLLCILEKERKNILFTGMPYKKGETVFSDFSKKILYSENDLLKYESTDIDMIYTSPSHINYRGDVMNISERIDLLKYARENNIIVIEDDYDSEFSYTGHPVPALRSIDGGERVIYIGTFSRLLIPSIRISFMVLTTELSEKYEKIRDNYNQTASKTEQIALCRYISDGHLYSRIKKTKKLYAEKTRSFYNVMKKCSNTEFRIKLSQSGFLVSISSCKLLIEKLKNNLISESMHTGIVNEIDGTATMTFSVSSIKSDSVESVAEIIKKHMESL